MTARHEPIGRPKHKGEASGVNFLVKKLPDDYVVVSNVDLPTGRHGRTFDHDVVVIAPHAIFTVELKSWGGLITGNRDRWQMSWSGYVQSPIPLTLDKARVLKSVLSAHRRSLGRVWVQGLVFVSAPDADLQTIEPDESLREQLDIDSMDLLRLAQAIHRRLGVDVPELHYPQLDSLDTAMAYLAPRVDA